MAGIETLIPRGRQQQKGGSAMVYPTPGHSLL